MREAGRDKKAGLALVGQPRPPEDESKPRPCFAVYTANTSVGGRNFSAGTWFHGVKNVSPDSPGVPFDLWVCAPLHVDAETVCSDDGGIGRLLRFSHRGRQREWVMPMEALAGKGEEVLKALMRQGLAVEYSQRRRVLEYINSHHDLPQVITTTARPGWHESGAFVLPGRSIGGSGEVRMQETGKGERLFSEAGELAAWQESVARLCLGNPLLIMCVSCALAGPLLKRVGVNGGGVHLVGDSSSGKTLGQLVAGSVWGRPELGGFVASWHTTPNGMEIEAAARNDTVLILDEIKQANPKYVQEMVYAIANGAGKGTMTRERETRQRLRWRVLALSSGERSLSEHAALSGHASHAGAELRLIDVNAGTRKHRAFDDLHGMSGEGFHHALSGAVAKHYGQAGPAFVEYLVHSVPDAHYPEAFASIRAQFATLSAQAGRVAARFAAIAMAGELATQGGILPWPPGTAMAACLQLFKEWLLTVGDDNAEDRHILRNIADFISRHGDSRFSNQAAALESSVHNRAGYWRLDGSGENARRVYLFSRSALVEACPGYALARITRALESGGVLAAAEVGRKDKKYRLPGGGAARFFVINPERLTAEEPAGEAPADPGRWLEAVAQGLETSPEELLASGAITRADAEACAGKPVAQAVALLKSSGWPTEKSGGPARQGGEVRADSGGGAHDG